VLYRFGGRKVSGGEIGGGRRVAKWGAGMQMYVANEGGGKN